MHVPLRTILLIVTVIVAERAVLRPSGGAGAAATGRHRAQLPCVVPPLEVRVANRARATDRDVGGRSPRETRARSSPWWMREESTAVSRRLPGFAIRASGIRSSLASARCCPARRPAWFGFIFYAPTTGCSCVSRRTAFPPTRPPAGPCRDLRWTKPYSTVTPSGGRTTGFGAASSPPSARRPRMPASPLGAVRATLSRG